MVPILTSTTIHYRTVFLKDLLTAATSGRKTHFLTTEPEKDVYVFISLIRPDAVLLGLNMTSASMPVRLQTNWLQSQEEEPILSWKAQSTTRFRLMRIGSISSIHFQ